MATPRFVAAPQVKDYATQILAIHEEGFRRRMSAAERSQDEQFQRDTAAYAARVSFAQEQLKAANAEVAAANKAILDIELKDAKGKADAVKALSTMARSTANAKMLADAVGAGRSGVPSWVRTDASDDKIQQLWSNLTRWDQVYPAFTENDDDPKFADRALIDEALAAVDKAPVSHGVKKVLAVGWLVAHGKIPKTISMESLKEAAVREAMGTNPLNWDGVSAQISDGYEALNPPGEPLATDVGEMLTAVNAIVDLGSKDGNNPDEAADSLERKGAKGGQRAAAKATALEEATPTVEELTPDYTAARALADQRLAEAQARAASVTLPTQRPMLDRISRTRNAYAQAFGPKSAKVTPEPDPVDELIAEVLAARTTTPTTRAAALPPRAGPQATTEEARRTMAEAEQIIREPVPASRGKPPGQLIDEELDRRGWGYRSGPAPKPTAPVHPAIPMLQEKGLLDLDDTHGELDMSTVPAEPLAEHRTLLEREGMIARDGTVRRARAARLASTTAEGRRAQAALDDAGGDLVAALGRLKDDRAKAIAVGLKA